MRRSLLLFVCVLLVLGLSGCLQTSDKLILKKDGSGSISSTYVVDLATFKELLLMAAEGFGMGDPVALSKTKLEDLPSVEHPAWAKAAAKAVEGYEITAATQVIEDGKRTTAIAARFSSLQVAAKAGAFFIMDATLSEVEKSDKVPTGAWKLELINTMAANPQFVAILPALQTQLKTLSTTVSLTLPTKILETNGKKSEDGMTVTWKITFDDLVDAQKTKDMNVVFEAAEDLKLKPFVHKADQAALQKRVIQPPPGVQKTKETKVGDEKGGDAKAGEAKAGEAKAGEAKAGEAKPGDGQAAKKEGGAGKADEPKKSAEGPKQDTPKQEGDK